MTAGHAELLRVQKRLHHEKRQVIRGLRFCTCLFVLVAAATSGSFSLVHWQQQYALARLQATIELENQARQTQDSVRLAAMIDPTADAEWRKELLEQTDGALPFQTVIEEVDLLEDIAIVKLRSHPVIDLPPSAFTLSRYRFYRTADGLWHRTFPPKEFWGKEEIDSLDLAHISFSYHPYEAAVIATTAPILDRLYPQFYQLVGLDLPVDRRKLHIEPQIFPAAETKWTYYNNHLRVPSYLVRATLAQSDANAFMEPVIAALARDALYAALEEYQPANMALYYAMFPALRDWLIVEVGGTLRIRDAEAERLLERTLAQGGMLHLRDLEPQRNESTADRLLRGQATQSIINYVMQTYGTATISALFHNLNTHSTWPELIAATYDVSLSEFEADWNRFLREQ